MSLAKSNARRATEHAKAMQWAPSQDVRAECKRLMRLRCITFDDLAAGTKIGARYWKKRLSENARLTPGLLRLFLTAIEATPTETERLHQLGAKADGWEV